MIPVIDRSELNQFGFDGSLFMRKTRDKIGGYEWHGPCPNGCGNKQLVISNGKYWCRMCGNSGLLGGGDIEISEEKKAEIEAKIKAIEKEKQIGKARGIRKLNTPDRNGLLLWQVFHANLMKNEPMLLKLQSEGIPERSVIHFGLGYNPRFHFNIEEKSYVAPALTFPVLWNNKCYNIRHRILRDNLPSGNRYRPIYKNLDATFLVADIPNKDYVVFVEGEKKAIVLWTNGIPAIALWGVRTWHAHWFDYFKSHYKRHYVIFDGDNSQVVEAAHKFASYIPGAKVIDLGGKPDDLIVSGQITPKKLLELLGEK